MAIRQACSVRALQSLTATQTTVRVQPSLATSVRQFEARVIRPAFVPVRWHSAPSNPPRVYDYNKIKQLSEAPSPERVLIDVREPSEYQDGYIPGAVNVPLKSRPDAIFLPEEEFEEQFGFPKPSHEQELIFYCKAGVRSSAAAGLAQQQGYPNTSEYRGSWLDWEKNGGKIEKP